MRLLCTLSSLSSFSSSSSVSFPTRPLLLHFSQFSTSSSWRHEEDSRNVRVSVWWDFENCNIPSGTNVFKVAHLITAAVRANGIKGPVQITAFGDVFQLSRANQEALSSTGISLNHVPQGGKNSADRSLLVDLMYWVSQNPPPAHLFLISGDRDFASILHRLRMNNYNVLLASTESAPGVLCSAASIMWHWHALIRGENLVGRHFNRPPDAFYGHFRVPLEDPFPVNGKPSFLRVQEVSELSSDPRARPIQVSELSSDPKPRPIQVSELSSDPKPRPIQVSELSSDPKPHPIQVSELTSDPKPRLIPKAVIKHIDNILKLNPKGLPITDLRSELGKCGIFIDKDLYGYKKFSRFLLSMPQILKLQANGDGHFIVHSATPKQPKEELESSTGTFGNGTEEQDPNLTAKLSNDDSSTGPMCVPVLLSDAHTQGRPLKEKPTSEFGKSIGEAMEGEPSRSPVSEQDPYLTAKLSNNDSSTEPMCVPVLSDAHTQGKPLEEKRTSKFGKSIGDVMEGEPSRSPVSELSAIEDSKQTNKVEADSNTTPSIGQHSKAKTGVFRRIWRKLLGNNDTMSENGSHCISEKCSTTDDTSKQKSCGGLVATYSGDRLGEAKTEGRTAEPMSEDANSVHQVLNSPDREFVKPQKEVIVDSAHDDKSSSNQGLLNSIRNWFKLWGRSTENSEVSEHYCEQNQLKNQSGKHHLFSSGSTENSEVSEHSCEQNQLKNQSGKHHPFSSSSTENSEVSEHSCEQNQLKNQSGKHHLFSSSSTENGEVGEHSCEQNQLKNQSGKHHLFSSSSFWQDMQSFMGTPTGVEIISRSKTRSEIAQNLLERGPPILNTLSTSELFDLLELLISDKKWVEEFPSKTFPFKLTLSIARKSSCMKPLDRANGLASIFSNKESRLSFKGPRKHDSDSDKKNENIPPEAGTNKTKTENTFPERTRYEMLGDCQKLVGEILRDYPEGYNIGSFRRLFLEKYGYHLDLKKLGYPKLVSLLQIMPGVTIASTFIVPTSNAPNVSMLETTLPSNSEKKASDAVANSNSDNESSDLPKKDDDFESAWEELGPACTDCNNKEELTLSSETTEANEKRTEVYYEPVLSEDETDGESCPPTEVPAKQRTSEEESSLIQILDSWYSSKENIRKDKTEDSDETFVVSENSLKLSSLAPKSEENTGSFGTKKRHRKYCFVSDTTENGKDKLIDGILGTLKKSSESDKLNQA
ncbi:uncharacterized protein LOC103499661 isoform X2 [Cucumis melo]|uniref:Uncharacterized protein LOC103499661 isoform X2 n=1 Tax=Cucumis melo TaxID=3656 RepID=A0ABM3LBZ2_CUCME|nr:uncharacterized protein LOC103499661 isoform X2 [Cucumis melo]